MVSEKTIVSRAIWLRNNNKTLTVEECVNKAFSEYFTQVASDASVFSDIDKNEYKKYITLMVEEKLQKGN